jgi:hypothetical protein
MKVTRIALLGLALGGVLLLGSQARAASISYLAIGEFIGGTGNNIAATGDTFISSDGVVIQYFSNTTTNYDLNDGESTFGDFGRFEVQTALATDTAVSADFELTIFQAAPQGGVALFTATLAGSLRIGQSGAYIQFANPLTQTIGEVTYDIVESDFGVPGRIALVPATITNNVLTPGVTNVQALLTYNVVPEPATLAMLGMGVLAPVGLMLRRRVRATV